MAAGKRQHLPRNYRFKRKRFCRGSLSSCDGPVTHREFFSGNVVPGVCHAPGGRGHGGAQGGALTGHSDHRLPPSLPGAVRSTRTVGGRPRGLGARTPVSLPWTQTGTGWRSVDPDRRGGQEGRRGGGEETASVLCAAGKAQGEPRALGAAGTTRKTRGSLPSGNSSFSCDRLNRRHAHQEGRPTKTAGPQTALMAAADRATSRGAAQASVGDGGAGGPRPSHLQRPAPAPAPAPGLLPQRGPHERPKELQSGSSPDPATPTRAVNAAPPPSERVVLGSWPPTLRPARGGLGVPG